MLRYLDSFDHYATADLTAKWTGATTPPNGNLTIAAVGRRSTNGLRLSRTGASGAWAGVSRTLDAQATWIIGFAYRINTLPGAVQALVQLLDTATLQVDLRLNTDGTLSVTRNATGLGTSVFALSAGQWYYLELKVLIHNTAGTVEVRVNGDAKLTLTGQDTYNTGNVSANVVRFGAHTNAGSVDVHHDFDDLYICDSQGSVNNNFLGDCRVDCLLPNANGDDREWALSAGSDDYAVVDEAAPNGDSDYAWDDTVGQRLLVGCQDLAALTSPAIKGVMVSASAKKSDAGGRGLGVNVKSGSTESDGPDTALGTAYTYVSRVLETDPATSAAWTEAGVNAAQIGVEVTS